MRINQSENDFGTTAGGVANGAPHRAQRKGPTGGWVE